MPIWNVYDKTLLYTRHNHDLLTYVTFVDLVKAFDNFDHTLLLQILKKYGAPPKLRSSIDRMYQDLKVVLYILSVRSEEDVWTIHPLRSNGEDVYSLSPQFSQF